MDCFRRLTSGSGRDDGGLDQGSGGDERLWIPSPTPETHSCRTDEPGSAQTGLMEGGAGMTAQDWLVHRVDRAP